MAERVNPSEQTSLSALLLLADGRFPAGGHAHSGGLEAAAALEGVRDVSELEIFLRGRAATAGLVAAAFAAAACNALSDAGNGGTASCVAVHAQLDRELDARLPSPALRSVSRRLGRSLLRAGRAIWPHVVLDELAAALARGPHQPIALGAVAAVAGLGPNEAAAAAMHDAVAGPATAAVRLLRLDPLAVHATLAKLGPELDILAAEAATQANAAPAQLPACCSPLLDILAEVHATWEVRLFAS